MNKKMTAAAFGGVLTSGFLVVSTAVAHADANSTFLQAVANAGFWAGQSARPSDKTLEDAASSVCSWKTSGQSPDYFAAAVQKNIFRDLTNPQAAQFVTIAISAYCP